MSDRHVEFVYPLNLVSLSVVSYACNPSTGEVTRGGGGGGGASLNLTKLMDPGSVRDALSRR